ncbi:MAG: PadR family transcriptional regulator [Coriobacteriales bacterium]|nr:PadR family transcriptional regulator [Coriobacteriales bacterium]
MGFPVTASLLDACVLSVVAHGDTYGYELSHKLHESLQVSESTLYPVLRRLQGSSCLRTYDLPHQGRNRRYYAITDEGRDLIARYRSDWRTFRNQIDGFLEDTE